MKNIHASDFIDKCTARLHFERHGVQLYTVVLQKCPPELLGRFEKILEDEQSHVELLQGVLHRYGANPHALTPSTRVSELESKGIMKAIRTSNFREIMDTLLSVELVDTANWEFLMMLAEKVGDKDAKMSFKKALIEETEHLKFIHRYLLKDLTGRRTVKAA